MAERVGHEDETLLGDDREVVTGRLGMRLELRVRLGVRLGVRLEVRLGVRLEGWG